MSLKSSRPRDVEKAQGVRFVDEPRLSTDSELAARPRIIQPRKSWRSRLISPEAIPWLLTCIFATTTILLLWERPESRRFGSYETRFSSDLNTLQQVPLEVRRFVGSPTFDSNGTMHMPEVDKTAKWPDNHKFVGKPSSEIDDNWLGLLEDRYFSVSEEEAVEAWGDRRHDYVDEEHGGYTAGLDVFHTLHCLNQVRMALYPERYQHQGTTAETQAAHLEHCLDSIRQHIQCYGSTTLVPTRWQPDAGRQYVDSEQEHVCRDFSYLRKYVRRRSTEGDLYVPRDKSLIGKADAEDDRDRAEVEAVAELKAVEEKEDKGE